MDVWSNLDMPEFKDEQGQTWRWDAQAHDYVVAGGSPDLSDRVDRGHASGGDNDLFDPSRGDGGSQDGNLFQPKNPMQEGYMARAAAWDMSQWESLVLFVERIAAKDAKAQLDLYPSQSVEPLKELYYDDVVQYLQSVPDMALGGFPDLSEDEWETLAGFYIEKYDEIANPDYGSGGGSFPEEWGRQASDWGNDDRPCDMCDLPAYRNGLCEGHYKSWQQTRVEEARDKMLRDDVPGELSFPDSWTLESSLKNPKLALKDPSEYQIAQSAPRDLLPDGVTPLTVSDVTVPPRNLLVASHAGMQKKASVDWIPERTDITQQELLNVVAELGWSLDDRGDHYAIVDDRGNYAWVDFGREDLEGILVSIEFYGQNIGAMDPIISGLESYLGTFHSEHDDEYWEHPWNQDPAVLDEMAQDGEWNVEGPADPDVPDAPPEDWKQSKISVELAEPLTQLPENWPVLDYEPGEEDSGWVGSYYHSRTTPEKSRYQTPAGTFEFVRSDLLRWLSETWGPSEAGTVLRGLLAKAPSDQEFRYNSQEYFGADGIDLVECTITKTSRLSKTAEFDAEPEGEWEIRNRMNLLGDDLRENPVYMTCPFCGSEDVGESVLPASGVGRFKTRLQNCRTCGQYFDMDQVVPDEGYPGGPTFPENWTRQSSLDEPKRGDAILIDNEKVWAPCIVANVTPIGVDIYDEDGDHFTLGWSQWHELVQNGWVKQASINKLAGDFGRDLRDDSIYGRFSYLVSPEGEIIPGYPGEHHNDVYTRATGLPIPEWNDGSDEEDPYFHYGQGDLNVRYHPQEGLKWKNTENEFYDHVVSDEDVWAAHQPIWEKWLTTNPKFDEWGYPDFDDQTHPEDGGYYHTSNVAEVASDLTLPEDWTREGSLIDQFGAERMGARPRNDRRSAVDFAVHRAKQDQFLQSRHITSVAEVAGICVKAKDTGRILMLQRSIADDEDPAAGTWEFPGGHVEEGEDPWDGAKREWEEETGVKLPEGERKGSIPSGPKYELFFYQVKEEKDVEIFERAVVNPDDPDGDDSEALAWWDPQDAKKNPALRKEVKKMNWPKIKQASSVLHSSDCAVHNEPANPAGPCSCHNAGLADGLERGVLDFSRGIGNALNRIPGVNQPCPSCGGRTMATHEGLAGNFNTCAECGAEIPLGDPTPRSAKWLVDPTPELAPAYEEGKVGGDSEHNHEPFGHLEAPPRGTLPPSKFRVEGPRVARVQPTLEHQPTYEEDYVDSWGYKVNPVNEHSAHQREVRSQAEHRLTPTVIEVEHSPFAHPHDDVALDVGWVHLAQAKTDRRDLAFEGRPGSGYGEDDRETQGVWDYGADPEWSDWSDWSRVSEHSVHPSIIEPDFDIIGHRQGVDSQPVGVVPDDRYDHSSRSSHDVYVGMNREINLEELHLGDGLDLNTVHFADSSTLAPVVQTPSLENWPVLDEEPGGAWESGIEGKHVTDRMRSSGGTSWEGARKFLLDHLYDSIDSYVGIPSDQPLHPNIGRLIRELEGLEPQTEWRAGGDSTLVYVWFIRRLDDGNRLSKTAVQTLDPATTQRPDINYVLDYNPEDFREQGWNAYLMNSSDTSPPPGLSSAHIEGVTWEKARDYLINRLGNPNNHERCPGVVAKLKAATPNQPFEDRTPYSGQPGEMITAIVPAGRTSKVAAPVLDPVKMPDLNFVLDHNPEDLRGGWQAEILYPNWTEGYADPPPEPNPSPIGSWDSARDWLARAWGTGAPGAGLTQALRTAPREAPFEFQWPIDGQVPPGFEKIWYIFPALAVIRWVGPDSKESAARGLRPKPRTAPAGSLTRREWTSRPILSSLTSLERHHSSPGTLAPQETQMPDLNYVLDYNPEDIKDEGWFGCYWSIEDGTPPGRSKDVIHNVTWKQAQEYLLTGAGAQGNFTPTRGYSVGGDTGDLAIRNATPDQPFRYDYPPSRSLGVVIAAVIGREPGRQSKVAAPAVLDPVQQQMPDLNYVLDYNPEDVTQDAWDAYVVVAKAPTPINPDDVIRGVPWEQARDFHLKDAEEWLEANQQAVLAGHGTDMWHYLEEQLTKLIESLKKAPVNKPWTWTPDGSKSPNWPDHWGPTNLPGGGGVWVIEPSGSSGRLSKVAMPYHVSPQRNREQIEQEGLRTQPLNHGGSPQDPDGVYYWDTEDQARYFGDWFGNGPYGEPYDIYQFDLEPEEQPEDDPWFEDMDPRDPYRPNHIGPFFNEDESVGGHFLPGVHQIAPERLKRLESKTVMGQVDQMYHVAPRRVREKIQREGLVPQPSGGAYDDGVYLWPALEHAQLHRQRALDGDREAAERHNDSSWLGDYDIYEVDTTGVPVERDPWIGGLVDFDPDVDHPNAAEAMVSWSPISSERVRLVAQGQKTAMGQRGNLPEGIQFIVSYDDPDSTGDICCKAYLGREVIGQLDIGEDGIIANVDVAPTYQRMGVATAMLEHMRKSGFDVEHSEDLSVEGQAWAEHTGSAEDFTCSGCGLAGSEIDRRETNCPKCGQALDPYIESDEGVDIPGVDVVLKMNGDICAFWCSEALRETVSGVVRQADDIDEARTLLEARGFIVRIDGT